MNNSLPGKLQRIWADAESISDGLNTIANALDADGSFSEWLEEKGFPGQAQTIKHFGKMIRHEQAKADRICKLMKGEE